MNRRDLLKFLGIGAAAAIVAPKALLTPDDAGFEQTARRYWPGWSQRYSADSGWHDIQSVFKQHAIIHISFAGGVPEDYPRFVLQGSPSTEGPYVNLKTFADVRGSQFEYEGRHDWFYRVVSLATDAPDPTTIAILDPLRLSRPF